MFCSNYTKANKKLNSARCSLKGRFYSFHITMISKHGADRDFVRDGFYQAHVDYDKT